MQSDIIAYSKQDITSTNLESFQVAQVCLLRCCSHRSKAVVLSTSCRVYNSVSVKLMPFN
jgi:hypothetical protein